VSKSTFHRQVADVKRGVAPLSDKKDSGRPPLLSDEQWDVVCGAILSVEETTNLVWVRTWLC
jgi:hypothetical protein